MFRLLRQASLVAAVLLPSTAASAQVFLGTLSGAAESPPVVSAGTGFATVTYDASLLTLRVQVNFSGLTGTTTAAHIHCCVAVPGVGTAGVATMTPSFAGFPLGVTSGTMDNTFDLNLAGSFNPAFVTANGGSPATARAALLAGLNASTAYFNIHTSFAGGGEIRAFLRTPFAIAISGGNNQATPVTTAFPLPLSVLVTDSVGSPVSGARVTFTVPASGASAVLPGNALFTSVLTDTQGIASLATSANATPGSYSVTANTIGSTGQPIGVVFSLANQSVIEVPALGPWGLAGLTLLLTAFALVRLRARRAVR